MGVELRIPTRTLRSISRFVLAGGGAGNLKGGRHIRYPKETPLANLHLTLLDQFGVRWDRIGDSTGKLEDHELSVG